MANGRNPMEGGIIPLARQRFDMRDEEEERRLRLQRVDPSSPMYDPGLPSIYARPSRLSRLGQQIKATPQRIRDFATGVIHSAGPWSMKATEAILPGQLLYSPEEIERHERYAASQLPRTPSGEITPAGLAGTLTGSIAPEFSLVGDAQALTRVPGHLMAGNWGGAGLEALGILGIGGALARARRPLEGIDNMQRSRLLTTISNAGEGRDKSGNLQYWNARIKEGFKGEGVSKAEADYIGIMDLLESDPNRKWTQEELLKYVNDNKFSLRDNIKEADDTPYKNFTMGGKKENYREISLIIEPGSPEVRAGHKKIDQMKVEQDNLQELHNLSSNKQWNIIKGVEELYSTPLEELAAMLSKERLGWEWQFGSGQVKTIKINGVDIDTALAQRVLNRRQGGTHIPFFLDPESIGAGEAIKILDNDLLVFSKSIDDAEQLLPPRQPVRGNRHGMGEGAIAHMRTTDRGWTHPSSGVREKVLYVEELQSDWAQGARGKNKPLEFFRRIREPEGAGFEETARQQNKIKLEKKDASARVSQQRDTLGGERRSLKSVAQTFDVGDTLLDDIAVTSDLHRGTRQPASIRAKLRALYGDEFVDDYAAIGARLTADLADMGLTPGQILFRAGHIMTPDDIQLLDRITTGRHPDATNIYPIGDLIENRYINSWGGENANRSPNLARHGEVSPEELSDYLKSRERLKELLLGSDWKGQPKVRKALTIGEALDRGGSGSPLRLVDPQGMPLRSEMEIKKILRVPATPYAQTEDWNVLMVRRAIQLAIDEGKSRIAFPTGRQALTVQKNLKGVYPTRVEYNYNPSSGVGMLGMGDEVVDVEILEAMRLSNPELNERELTELASILTDKAIGHPKVSPDELEFYIGRQNAAELLSDGSREGIKEMKESLRELVEVRDELEALNASQMEPSTIRNRLHKVSLDTDKPDLMFPSTHDWNVSTPSLEEMFESRLGENWSTVDVKANGEIVLHYIDPDTRHTGDTVGSRHPEIPEVTLDARREISPEILGDVLMEEIFDLSTDEIIYHAGDIIDEAMLARLEDHAMRAPTGSVGALTPTVSTLAPRYSKGRNILAVSADKLDDLESFKIDELESRGAFLKSLELGDYPIDHNAMRRTLGHGMGNWRARQFTTPGVTGIDADGLYKGYHEGIPTFHNAEDTKRYNELLKRYHKLVKSVSPRGDRLSVPGPFVLRKEKGITDVLDRGMEAFYDNQIPKAVKQVLKKLLSGKLGAKKEVARHMEIIRMPEVKARNYVELDGTEPNIKQIDDNHLSIVITPELIQAVREKGFFLNAAGGLITLKGLKERKEKDKEKHMYGGIVKLRNRKAN